MGSRQHLVAGSAKACYFQVRHSLAGQLKRRQHIRGREAEVGVGSAFEASATVLHLAKRKTMRPSPSRMTGVSSPSCWMRQRFTA